MLAMLELPLAHERFASLRFKCSLNQRVKEIRADVERLERACRDIKMSLRLRKVSAATLRQP
jgi:hypothetical protein